MPPRRPNAPHPGAAKARAAARSAGRPAPVRQQATRPPSPGRGSSRPLPGVPTPPIGLSTGAVRNRPPLIRPVTMLAGVLVVLALLLAPYVRPWVTQRSQLAEGRNQLRQLTQQVDALKAERARWNDPNYVRAQARARLFVVMPGETGLVVLDDATRRVAQADPRSVAAALPAGNANRVWYTKVWDSIRMAGDPTTEQARSAAPR